MFKKLKFIPSERVDFLKNAYLFFGNQRLNHIKYPINDWEIYNPIKDFERQKVPYGMNSFRLSQINVNYE